MIKDCHNDDSKNLNTFDCFFRLGVLLVQRFLFILVYFRSFDSISHSIQSHSIRWQWRKENLLDISIACCVALCCVVLRCVFPTGTNNSFTSSYYYLDLGDARCQIPDAKQEIRYETAFEIFASRTTLRNCFLFFRSGSYRAVTVTVTVTQQCLVVWN